jgi:hypothetical protein
MNKSLRIADTLSLPLIVVDHLILICLGCRQERTIWPDVPLVGAEACVEWLKTKHTKCPCGATHGDVKMHLKNPEVLEEP